jgi:hypothetical protein
MLLRGMDEFGIDWQVFGGENFKTGKKKKNYYWKCTEI